MAVTVKSEREIDLMREAGKRLEYVHEKLAEIIKPGISTWEIDKVGEKLIREQDGIPNFLNYNGFPASICVSVNEEVVHGIPSKDRLLKDGDIVSHSDAARTHAVGKVAPEVLQLMERTRQSFFEGIKKATDGAHLYDISNAIADYIEPFGYGIVEELVGHGIGTALHEDPQIPNFRQRRRGLKLRDWTVVAADGLPSAHYENTILVTTGEPEILTLGRL